MKCKQCGKCCKGIRLNFEPDSELSQIFEEILEVEAFKLHPVLMIFSDKKYKYYNCKMLVDNKCSIHKNKPDICRTYPIKGHSFKDLECGYFNKEDSLDLKLEIAYRILRGNYNGI